MVLARLDGADDDEVGARRGIGGCARLQAVDAERRNQHRRRDRLADQVRREHRGRRGRVHDDRVRERGHGVEPLQVLHGDTRARVFRMRRRDQVMDQRDEGGAGAAEFRDGLGLFHQPVGDEQEDGAAFAGQHLGQAGTAAAEGEAREGDQRGAARGAAGGGGAGAARPGELQLRGEVGDHAARHGGVSAARAAGDEGDVTVGGGEPAAGIGGFDAIDSGGRPTARATEEPGNVEQYVHARPS